jgi:glycerol-3-phosphate dehydrogenase (NAD(P)+)
MTRVAVLGSGSWGTAFSMVLADAGSEVTLWGRRPELCEAINNQHHNPDYLPELALPESITATPSPADALQGAQVVVLALPAQTLRSNLQRWAPLLPPSSAPRAG